MPTRTQWRARLSALQPYTIQGVVITGTILFVVCGLQFYLILKWDGFFGNRTVYCFRVCMCLCALERICCIQEEKERNKIANFYGTTITWLNRVLLCSSRGDFLSPAAIKFGTGLDTFGKSRK